ncbi:cysteine hydrolase family protein [Maridesulfovibrio ferrireducens]|uniref:cysteine hydrolase family protein n=1 Tax=Maridesulfovibrio ferrireducens TaxID=246191 RepID=UPI001A2DBFFB|nr:cysteine hydrolase family protein [Maridesulfovibrio ferrireducens]MBI9112449.1 cysteine hydrolase [Maridesulfovibrio ferrireducens]
MTALLVIDMQQGVFEGNKKRFDSANIIERINLLIDYAHLKNIPVIFIRHHTPAEDDLKYGSDGWQILPAMHKKDSDIIVEKTCCDSFCKTDLEEQLNKLGVKKLIVTGCCTDFCVDTTVREAASKGFEVTVVSDAHTTAEKPYLEAKIIIEHHNYVWSEMETLHPINVRPAAEIIK